MVCAVLCGWIVLSQHRGSDGVFWYRTEHAPVTVSECRALVKHVTTRSLIGLTKWYDVSPAQLQKHFGQDAPVTLGSWIACWPEGTVLGSRTRDALGVARGRGHPRGLGADDPVRLGPYVG